jgi:hypothetical protein
MRNAACAFSQAHVNVIIGSEDVLAITCDGVWPRDILLVRALHVLPHKLARIFLSLFEYLRMILKHVLTLTTRLKY